MLEVVVLEALGEELSASEPNQAGHLVVARSQEGRLVVAWLVGHLVAAWLVGHQDNLEHQELVKLGASFLASMVHPVLEGIREACQGLAELEGEGGPWLLGMRADVG
jgi:hypothetical protein